MEFIKIGNIANIHGIKGELSIYPYTDDIDNFCKYKEIYIGDSKEKFKVLNARPHKNMVLFLLEGIASANEALNFKTKDIFIDSSKLKKLDDNSYYVKDLIGIEVFDNLSNEFIGIITDVINNQANDVYEITIDDKKIYIPAIHQVIKKVDVLNKKMFVEIMEGLK